MEAWSSWLYHYGVGGLFTVATYVVLVQSGALRLGEWRHQRIFAGLIGGLILFGATHAVWNYLAVR